MSVQKGRDLLLKIRNDEEGNFLTIAGLRARSIAFNAETIDITHSESTDRWRQLLSGAGVRSARLSGSGLFKDDNSMRRLREIFFGNTHIDWQIFVPRFGLVQGLFQITAFEFTGQHDRELTFDMALESAGPLNFSPTVENDVREE